MAERGAWGQERPLQREEPGSAALGRREWGWGAGLARGAVGGAVGGRSRPREPGDWAPRGGGGSWAGPRGRGLGRLPATPPALETRGGCGVRTPGGTREGRAPPLRSFCAESGPRPRRSGVRPGRGAAGPPEEGLALPSGLYFRDHGRDGGRGGTVG